jgi:hypothetical protein
MNFVSRKHIRHVMLALPSRAQALRPTADETPFPDCRLDFFGDA